MLVGLAAISLTMWSNPELNELQHCLGISRADARLACYDKALTQKQPAKGGVAPASSHAGAGS